MKKIFTALAVVALAANFAYANGFKPKQLEGKWEGAPPKGGILELTLEVDGKQITGKGRIRGAQGKPSVSGTVDGGSVEFETYFHGTHATVKYACSWEELDVLQCKTPAGFETSFLRQK